MSGMFSILVSKIKESQLTVMSVTRLRKFGDLLMLSHGYHLQSTTSSSTFKDVDTNGCRMVINKKN